MKLFVAKLPPAVDTDRLRTMFESFGEVVNAKVIMDHDTGSSKGYGFVEMGNEAAGQAAIQNLNGAQVDGNTIVVKESDPPGTRPARSGPPRSGGFNRGGGGDRPRFGGGGGGGDRFSGGGDRPRFDRNNDRGGNSDRYNQDRDRDRGRKRYEDDDDEPRRRRF